MRLFGVSIFMIIIIYAIGYYFPWPGDMTIGRLIPRG